MILSGNDLSAYYHIVLLLIVTLIKLFNQVILDYRNIEILKYNNIYMYYVLKPAKIFLNYKEKTKTIILCLKYINFRSNLNFKCV